VIGILRRADPVIAFLPPLLACASLVLVYSASSILGLTGHNDPYYFLMRRSVHLAIGLVAFVTLAHYDYRRLVERHAGRAFLAVLALLLVVAVLEHGVSSRGARRWVSLFGATFQPTEIARVVVVLFLARYLARKGEGIRSFAGGFLPALVVGGLAVVLIAIQPNLSSAGVLFGVVLAMLFFGGARPVHLLGVLALGATGFLAMLAKFEYQRERVMSFLSFLFTGRLDTLGSGWQLDQSLIALGSGGLFGRGYGRSLQKFLFLPDPHTDFILAIVGEEGGYLAAGGLVLALVVLLARGYRTAFRATDDLGFLLAAGITTQLACYTFVNTGVATGLFPTTGLPLPFISYGGSALVMNLAAAGILVNISARQAEARVRVVSEAGPGSASSAGTLGSRRKARPAPFGAVGARGFAGGRR
jgi:cell division protein FtsW